MNKKNYEYNGWELKFFDKSKNFRNYQLSLIKDHLKGHIAEVGPGNGINLSNYYKYPKKIDLYEPTKKLYLELKKKFKNNNKIKFYNKVFGGTKKYNAILYLDVIEHIKEDKKEIIKAFKLLKKNGNLIINVPAFLHLYSNFDRDVGHFKRYSKNDFKKILNYINYKNVTFIYYDSIGYLLSFLSKILTSNYKKNFEKKIKLWDSMIWMSKILDYIVCRMFGKSLLIIVKK
tara:strand:+ start:359 stop:1051 length:693 start_codon:yes stop_codon:yes gene_type:complete